MNFMYRLIARILHPYNRPALAGNITLLLLAFLYLSLSIITAPSGQIESKDTYNNSLKQVVRTTFSSPNQ